MKIEAGLMIEPIDLGGNSRAFLRREIDAINAARAASATEEQIRGLVRQLVEARKTLLVELGLSLQEAAQCNETAIRPTAKARTQRRNAIATA